MLEVLVSLVLAGLAVSFIEYLYRTKRLDGETARKIVHITHGLYVATWPFFVSWQSIIYLELVFLVAVLLERQFKVFGSQRAIARLSWGELFYPLGIILLIITHQARWVFVLAVLHLALADAFAALVGVRFGKHNSYTVFGQRKSLAGTVAFFVTSMVLTLCAMLVVGPTLTDSAWLVLLLLPIGTTLAENVGVFGIDNLLVPLVFIGLFGAL